MSLLAGAIQRLCTFTTNFFQHLLQIYLLPQFLSTVKQLKTVSPRAAPYRTVIIWAEETCLIISEDTEMGFNQSLIFIQFYSTEIRYCVVLFQNEY